MVDAAAMVQFCGREKTRVTICNLLVGKRSLAND